MNARDSRSRSRVLAMLAMFQGACAASGSSGGATVVIAPAPPTAAEQQPARIADARSPSLGEVVLDAGRAMTAAARGEPHDARWDCEGMEDSDLRATDPEARGLFAAAHAKGEPALHVLAGLELASPPRTGKSARWPSFFGDLVISRDGSLAWTNPTASEADPEKMMVVSELPPGLRRDLDGLARTVSTPSCGLPTLMFHDDDAVRWPFEPRAAAIGRLKDYPAKVAQACAPMRGATGPWRVLAQDLLVLFSSEHGVLALVSQVAAPRGRLCLGQVRFHHLEIRN